MKAFIAIAVINVLVVIGIIGFVIWQFFDSGNPMGLIILAIILLGFLGFFMYIGVPGMILRWRIKSTGERARAIILERRMGDLEMYTGGDEYGHNGRLASQQVVLKLEVRPNGGVPYIAEDRFWITPTGLERLIPGRELQVAIARNNPQKVVSMPETIVIAR